jgi:hypothetical protein
MEMAKYFSSLEELHRTFLLSGPNFTVASMGAISERQVQASRLDKGYGPWKAPKYRLNRYHAFLYPSSEALGVKLHGQLIPIVISHAWGTQDFARFATPWETNWSVLCDSDLGYGQWDLTIHAGGSRQLYAPVVEHAGGGDVMVVGHVGVVNGSKLCVAASLAVRAANDPIGAKMRGIAIFVNPDRAADRPPQGWEHIGATDSTYRVHTAVDGRVIQILSESHRGPEGANWVIDGAVEIAVTAGSIKLAKYGMRMGRSLFNIAGKPVGRAPILSGPTIELAKAEVAAQTAATTARQERVMHILAKEEATSGKSAATATRSQNAAKGASPAAREERHVLERADTNLSHHPRVFERTQMPDEVVRAFIGENTFKEMVRSGRYDAAMKAQLAGFYGEYRATLAARFGTPTGFQVPINEWREIVERLAAKWAVPI